MTRLVAYSAYAIGSAVFLAAAASRGNPLMATGSGLFLIGTLSLLVPMIRERRRKGDRSAS